MKLAERLHEKGWSGPEIEQALHHLSTAEQRKHPLVRFTERSTYWLLLFALVVAIGALCTFVFPFLALLPFSVSLIVAAVIGGVLGTLFAHVIHDIDAVSHGHHVLVIAMTFAVSLGISGVVLRSNVWLGLAFSVLFCGQYLIRWMRA